MTNRAKTCKNLFCCAALTASLASSSLAAPRTPPPPPPAGGIGAETDAEAAQALDLLNQGKLPEAAQAYSTLIARYPNSGAVPEALFRLGYIQYVQGQYDLAVTTLKRIVSPPASPAIKAAGDALIPTALAAKAGKMSPTDPGRKTAFQDAIAQFDAFIQKYPQSPQVESANYGRALSSFQMQDYDAAIKTLQENLSRFANSETILDSEDLLAVVLTAQANEILKSHGDTDTAFAKFREAIGHLVNIIRKRTDVALANDAQFQIAEVLFARGNAEQGPKRKADLSNAILAYRAVQPKEAMLQAQQALVNETAARERQAVLQRNQAGVALLQQVQDHQNAKLEAMKQAPDQTLNAQLRIAACYFYLQKYDETRVVVHYLQPFAEADDQKKQLDYYLVLTYASQGITDKAEEAYNTFQSSYKGDPLGENLPLVMGAAFLTGSNMQPDRAIHYLQQERELYPKSSLVNEALNQQAAAMIGLKRYNDAIKTYDEFLKTNPPKDQAAEAEVGIATIYQNTGKLPDAIKQYQKVASDFAGTPAAERAAFYAAGIQVSVNMTAALPMLQDFIQKYPDGKFTGQAMMMLGQVQASTGNTGGAKNTFDQIIDRFPKSEFAPQAYFQGAAMEAKAGKTDDMVATLKKFIAAYPDNKDIYYAYDTIGQTQVSKGKIEDAIATYNQMAEQHSDNPSAPQALYRTAELWRRLADSLGQHSALNPSQRKTWDTDLSNSVAASEKVLEKFPDAGEVGLALKTLLADQEMYLTAQTKKPAEIDRYFHSLAEKYGSNASVQSRILFTLATFTYQKDPALGLAEMAKAYKPNLVYAPEDLDLYGSSLIEQGKAADAYKIYQKIATDYPTPPNVAPTQATPAIQEAQATALFGMATALEKEGKTADAGKLFTQLKTYYPWSPKVVEANFGIAKSMVQEGKSAQAQPLLVAIVASRTAPPGLRARAFLLIGDIQAAKGDIDDAIDSYLKTALYYGGVPDAAAEGLWKGAQALEKQAATLTEQSTPKKSDQIQRAIDSYKGIVSKYPNSPFVQKAQDRLNALGAH